MPAGTTEPLAPRQPSGEWANRLWGAPSAGSVAGLVATAGPLRQAGSLDRREGSLPILARGSRLNARTSEKWEIDPVEIVIAKRPDGSLWVLGEGGSGSVRSCSGALGRLPMQWSDLLKLDTLSFLQPEENALQSVCNSKHCGLVLLGTVHEKGSGAGAS
jgi:hypothetical protein